MVLFTEEENISLIFLKKKPGVMTVVGGYSFLYPPNTRLRSYALHTAFRLARAQKCVPKRVWKCAGKCVCSIRKCMQVRTKVHMKVRTITQTWFNSCYTKYITHTQFVFSYALLFALTFFFVRAFFFVRTFFLTHFWYAILPHTHHPLPITW